MSNTKIVRNLGSDLRQNLLAVIVAGAVIAAAVKFPILLAIGPVVIAYFVPALIANHRKVPNQGSVLVINLFLGWTFIGWVAALAMAARSKSLPVAAELETTR